MDNKINMKVPIIGREYKPKKNTRGVKLRTPENMVPFYIRFANVVSMKPIYALIILVLIMPGIGVSPVKISSNSNPLISYDVKIPPNSKPLCENSSSKDTTKIIFSGDETNFHGLNIDHTFMGDISVSVDFARREFNISQIDKVSGRTVGGAMIEKADGNESIFKVSGKNVKIVEPCDLDAPVGGLACRVNFTSRKTSIFSAFSVI